MSKTKTQPKPLSLVCDKCGPVKSALLDGYGVGDRLLEGVMFKIELLHNKPVATFAEPDDYTAGLNARKWNKLVAEDALTPDCGLQCPVCESDVEIK